jgi:hypothetical protein
MNLCLIFINSGKQDTQKIRLPITRWLRRYPDCAEMTGNATRGAAYNSTFLLHLFLPETTLTVPVPGLIPARSGRRILIADGKRPLNGTESFHDGNQRPGRLDV